MFSLLFHVVLSVWSAWSFDTDALCYGVCTPGQAQPTGPVLKVNAHPLNMAVRINIQYSRSIREMDYYLGPLVVEVIFSVVVMCKMSVIDMMC